MPHAPHDPNWHPGPAEAPSQSLQHATCVLCALCASCLSAPLPSARSPLDVRRASIISRQPRLALVRPILHPWHLRRRESPQPPSSVSSPGCPNGYLDLAVFRTLKCPSCTRPCGHHGPLRLLAQDEIIMQHAADSLRDSKHRSIVILQSTISYRTVELPCYRTESTQPADRPPPTARAFLELVVVRRPEPARVHEDGAVDEQSSRDRHVARRRRDQRRVRENHRECETGRLISVSHSS